MVSLREQIDSFVKRVRDLAEHVKGNEQATKQSLIGPFFTLLGYDLTDPRECLPEYKADFGKDRSTKPIDWAFRHNGVFAFFVEAKEISRKLAGFDEQLADYFAKEPTVKLGILTNGGQWRFFTDLVNGNVMDREPFAKWDVFSDEPPPIDVITLLLKAQFNPELIRAYAQRQQAQNLLVNELTRLLEPATEFTKLAITNVETRNLTQAVVESWKPIVASALNEWARQRMLTAALAVPQLSQPDAKVEPQKIEATNEELSAFEAVKTLLGSDCQIGFDPSVNYFKIHLADKRNRVFLRLQLGKRQTNVWVPLPQEKVALLSSGRPVTVQSGWPGISLGPDMPLSTIAELLKAAYAHLRQGKNPESSAPDMLAGPVV